LLKCPDATVTAFEMNPDGQSLMLTLAELNRVSNRISVHGACGVQQLSESARRSRNSLIIMDVEGYEDVLLQPAKVAGLNKATILVEVHDFVIPGLSRQLVERFKSTHTIERINERERQLADVKL